ncbi:MAG: GNAT family acetyltransferase [Myxococcota bacterium]|nr:GNAT family acetyltransferase [Myxococcota bacterium]
MEPLLTTANIRPFRTSDAAAVISLWESCELLRPWNDPMKDIQRKLQVQPEMFLVAAMGDEVVGTVMAGYEGHRGWVNYLAVAPGHRRSGLGRAMMNAAERLLQDAGCPKLNVQVRGTNPSALQFYERLGYHVEDVVSLGKRLEHDGPE